MAVAAVGARVPAGRPMSCRLAAAAAKTRLLLLLLLFAEARGCCSREA
jgi:hypothetical protein